jgi:hypothetical protein
MPGPFTTPVAGSVPFEPNRNPGYGGGPSGIESTDVQNAIEEVVGIVTSKARFAMVFCHNSTVGNNNWLGFSELVPSNTTPLIIPVASQLKEIAFSYNGLSVDGQMKIYKNGLLPGNVIYTMTLTNQNNFILVSGLNILLAQGDRISAQWVDTGQNPSDAALQFFFQTV